MVDMREEQLSIETWRRDPDTSQIRGFPEPRHKVSALHPFPTDAFSRQAGDPVSRAQPALCTIPVPGTYLACLQLGQLVKATEHLPTPGLAALAIWAFLNFLEACTEEARARPAVWPQSLQKSLISSSRRDSGAASISTHLPGDSQNLARAQHRLGSRECEGKVQCSCESWGRIHG